MTDFRLVIVGAGLAGLTAAVDVLNDPAWNGEQIAVVEREPLVGGRLRTEELDGAVFDHGAQFFTVRSPAFGHHVERWRQAGVVEEWCRGFAEVDGYPRYRVAGGMQSLAEHLADALADSGVTIMTSSSASLDADDESWVLNAGDAMLAASALLLTPPVPATRALLTPIEDRLRSGVATTLADFDCHRVLALLANLDGPAPFPAPGALQQPQDPVFTFVADNQAKGISDQPGVTFHTAHDRSAELWSLADEDVIAALEPAAAELVAPARISSLRLRRWPCSGPVTPLPDPFLVAADDPGLLVLAGDGFGSSKVEGAFSSGLAAATEIREHVG